MRVLIYEPDHRGHHYAYLSHVLPELCEIADEVTLATTPSGAASPQFQLHLAPLASRFSVDTSIGEKHRRNEFQYAFQALSRLKRVAARLQPDHVYLPYGEGMAQLAGLTAISGFWPLPRRAESEVLMMRGGYQYPAATRRRELQKRISPRLIDRGRWTRIHHLNPDDLVVLRRQAKDPARYRLMPDPVETPAFLSKVECRRRLGIPETGRYIGCAGGIDRRKGMHLLVRAFAASESRLRADDRLLLAGPLEAQLREVIRQDAPGLLADGRMVVIDRPLAAEEVAEAIAALDVVATPYPTHLHSASIVIQAAACGRPVLGSAIGWMHRTIEEFQLGWTCNVRNPEELCRRLVQAVEASSEFEAADASKRFAAFHSPENFRAHWLLRLRERLNLPADGKLIPWEFVFLSGDSTPPQSAVPSLQA